MRHSNKLLMILALGIVSMMLWGCGASASHSNPDPATREEIDPGRYIVRLTARAAERLDVQTVEVQAGRGAQSVIPFNAVMYFPDGSSWTYVMTGELEYVRESITVEDVIGDTAILTEGPAPGAQVVTVGVSEFWGIESGVGE